MFLPFILAYSPRACVDLKITELAKLREYGQEQVQVDGSTKTKELIEGMAMRRGFSQNLSYLKFVSTIFHQGLLRTLLYSLD